MEAAVAGDFNVPLWLVTGDSAGMIEAEQIVPGVKTVVVKEAMDEFAACCYSPQKTAGMIFEAARDTVKNPPSVRPLRFGPPVEMKIEIAESDYRDKLKSAYPDIFLAADTVTFNGTTVTELWSRYCKIQNEVKSQ